MIRRIRRTRATVRPRRTRRAVTAVTVAAAALVTGCRTPVLGPVPVNLAPTSTPQVPDAADPFVLADGGRYYLFSTANHYRMPVRTLTRLDQTLSVSEGEAATIESMPTRPAWAINDAIWAPTVARIGNRYLMYFTGQRQDPPKPEANLCIGRAWADNVTGPYVPDVAPWHCGLTPGGRGALDPEIVVDKYGGRSVLMTFQDTNDVLWSVPINEAGDPATDPRPILRWRYPWHGRTIENPTLAYDPSKDDYVLFYSAGSYTSATYSTGIARCLSPQGPCVDNPAGPWMSAPSGTRTGPGGLSVFNGPDGVTRVAYHTWAGGAENAVAGRSTHFQRLLLGDSPTVK